MGTKNTAVKMCLRLISAPTQAAIANSRNSFNIIQETCVSRHTTSNTVTELLTYLLEQSV